MNWLDVEFGWESVLANDEEIEYSRVVPAGSDRLYPPPVVKLPTGQETDSVTVPGSPKLGETAWLMMAPGFNPACAQRANTAAPGGF
jgi:hypothetical protein